jgi:hypothetical protein
MKSIFLFDTSLRLVKAIELCGDVQIKAVATQGHYVKDQELIKKANPFLKGTRFINSSVEVELPIEKLDLNYELIQAFRPTQYKVEQYLNRLGIEQFRIQYIYYSALSFFYKLFKNKEIDAVLTVLPLHGTPLEMIPIDMAIYYNKPAYTFDKLYANPDGFVLWGIWNYSKKQYVDLSLLDFKPDLNKYLYYKSIRKYTPTGKALYSPSISRLTYIGKIKIVIKTLFSKNDSEKKAFINSFMGQFPRIGFFYLYFTNWHFRYNYKTHKRTCSYYKSISVSPDLDQAFIYYPLHLDPEAVTLVREDLSNQLTIIKMISDNLPDGANIYIKEHPVVFSFLKKKNLRQNWYFFLSLSRYRSKNFYKELLKIPNVKILSMNSTSEKLVKNSVGIATINGTVSLEAAIEQKPILIFGDKLPLLYIEKVYAVNSTESCKKAITEIFKDKSRIYKLEDMEKYLFEMHVKADALNSELFDKNSDIVTKINKIIKSLFS